MTATILDHDWWPVPVPGNVTIGERSWLYSSYAFLHYASRRPAGVAIGSDTGVYIGTMFDLGPDGECVIGDFGTIVGPTISTNARVAIGDFAFVSYHVTIADSPYAAPPGSYPPRDSAGGDVVIGDNVWIGVRATIAGPVSVGEGAVIGAATYVDFDVPPFAIVAGHPSKVVGWAR
ncbi:MAG TPA: DapH/DapD/GlmU-related protein [Actinomycetota bacterium]|nr:DapH/DapD/GlmU-related protein [Actinomycetota bacterium]